MLPFVVEFVKFVTGFAVIVAVALLALHFASAAMLQDCSTLPFGCP